MCAKEKKQKKEQKSLSYPKKIDIQKKKTWPKRRCFSSRRKRRRASELCVWMKSIRVLLSVIYSGVCERERTLRLSVSRNLIFIIPSQADTHTPQKTKRGKNKKKRCRGRPKTTTTKKKQAFESEDARTIQSNSSRRRKEHTHRKKSLIEQWQTYYVYMYTSFIVRKR